MAYSGTAPYLSRFDGNQAQTVMGVIGTLGTSDTTGSALMLPAAINAATGAQYVWIAGTDVTVGGGGSNVNVITGTINSGTVVGNIAHGSADSGNPVKVGGKYNSTVPALTTGQRSDLQVDSAGYLRVRVGNNSIDANVALPVGDGNTNSAGLVTTPETLIWNGGSWDRERTANAANNTLGTGLLGAGVLGQDSGGTYHSLAISTGGSIGTIILPNIPGGTLNSVTVTGGTLNAGTVSNTGTNINIITGTITSGTITGVDLNAAAQTANPISIGGTDSGGTVRTILVDSTGVIRSTGSAVMTVGTLTTGTLQNLVSGTINALAAGTITAGTTVVTTGTVVGNVASGGTSTGNPVKIAGVSSDGIVRTAATDTSGVFQVNLGNVAIGTFGGQDAVAQTLTSGFFFTPNFAYNGATWDRFRVANNATNTVGTGLLATGILGQDSGGTYHNIAVTTGGSIGTIVLPNTPGGTINLGTTVEIGRSFSNFNSAGTTTISSAAGILHTVTINTPVASDVITLFNSAGTSTAVIAKITLPASLLNEGPNTAIYNIAFGSLTLSKTSTSDVTVSYR